jgi:thiol-disulfide isomerase/thioredoxin
MSNDGAKGSRCALKAQRPTRLDSAILSIRRCAVAVAALIAIPAFAVEVGGNAPDFRLPQLGKDAQLGLNDVHGKVVLVDFWASWCGPCRESLPQYEKLYTSLSRNDFEIVAVNLDEDLADAKKFLAAHPVTYPVVLDPAGDVPKNFGLVGMPTSYLVDRDGVVRLRNQSFKPQDIEALRAKIDKLAKEPAHAR